GDPSPVAIDHGAEVELLGHLEPLLDIDAADLLAGRAGLVRHELHPQDLLGELTRFGGAALRDLHSAALAATASVDLRFDDDERIAGLRCEALRGGFRLVHGEGWIAFGNGDTVLGEDLFALVLVDLHAASFAPCPTSSWDERRTSGPVKLSQDADR